MVKYVEWSIIEELMRRQTAEIKKRFPTKDEVATISADSISLDDIKSNYPAEVIKIFEEGDK